jgi:aerobic-type carbon monoxide dehydrogenase small subunit (CoxS/CutS family)
MATPTTVHIWLNGKERSAPIADDTEPLLFVLRNQMDQKGPKFGCGIAQCGSCTVILNGAPVRSCVTQCRTVAAGSVVDTLDGMATDAGRPSQKLHPLQSAFIAEQAAQCGFCMNGMIVGAKSWLDGRIGRGIKSVPSEAEVKQFLSGKSPDSPLAYICRCGAHGRVVRAIQRAAKEMAS